MPRRMTTAARKVIYPVLVARDGERCRLCGRRPEQTAEEFLEIDHVDGDSEHNVLDNYRLLCKPCNVGEENRLRAEIVQKSRAGRSVMSSSNGKLPSYENGRAIHRVPGGREREKKNGNTPALPHIDSIHDHLDYGRGSLEMQANEHFEVPWVTWLVRRLLTEGPVNAKDAVNAGAEHVGCNPSTAKKYLDKKTSSEGMFELVKDPITRRSMVHLRSNVFGPRSTDGPADHAAPVNGRTSRSIVSAGAKRQARRERKNGHGKPHG